MHIIEILNAYPGETFIQEHARAIVKHTDIRLSWAYTQTSKTGRLAKPAKGLYECMAIPNFSRLSKWNKLKYRLLFPFTKWDKVKKRAITRSIAASKPDLIHFHFAGTAIQWAWAAEALEIPYSFSLRGSDIQVAPFTIKGYTENLRSIAQKARAIHAVTEDIKEQFCKLTNTPAEKVKVIRTTISPDWQNIKRKPEKGLLVSIGRLQWVKGYPDLLLAAKILKDEKVPYQLIIIGDGPERQLLEFMIRDLQLEKHVQLIGKKTHDEIKTYLTRADLLVLPSLMEGFPNVLGEAMMAGVPVVTTDCNGVTEVLKKGENAWIAETGNPKSLAVAIALAIQDKRAKETFSEQSRHLAASLFSSIQHSEDFVRFWQNAIRK